MPTTMTEADWKAAIAAGHIPVVQLATGDYTDPLALPNDDGTVTRYEGILECLKARSDRYFEMGLQRRLVSTTHQSMEPSDPGAVLLTCSWGWRSAPLSSLRGGRQVRAPKPFREAEVEWAKAEVDRLYERWGRTITLWERHLSVNRVLYVRG